MIIMTHWVNSFLDQNVPQSANSPQFPPAMVSFSNTDLVIRSSTFTAALPTSIFGTEPQHNWCYYYQKADLARQHEDWKQIAELGDEARANGLTPTDIDEWLLFVEGYERMGRYSDANQLLNLYQP